MLIELRFKNFRCFRDEQALSLVAGSVRLLPDNVVRDPELTAGFKLLRSAVVLGANASGKSSLFEAVLFIRRMVLASVEGAAPRDRIRTEPFLLDADSAGSPSEFEVSFVSDGVRFQYGFIVSPERIEEEWLYSYPHGRRRTLIARTPDRKRKWGGPALRGEKTKIQSLTRPDALFLSVAAKFNHEQLTPIFEWLTESLAVLFPWGGMSQAAAQYTSSRAVDDPAFQQWLLNYLRAADLGVSDLKIKSQTLTLGTVDIPEDADDATREMFEAVSRAMALVTEQVGSTESFTPVLLHVGTNGPIPIPFEEESRGTRRLFQILGPIANTLEEGSTLFVDEMATSLHPRLARQLIEAFHDPVVNPKGAQLILNTHDPTLLDSSLFRKDQMWFTEKDADGISSLIPLSAFSGVRSDQAIQWHYLAGRFGGVPIVAPLQPVPSPPAED